MKRKDIVAKLIKEGFSEKTLAAMSDKQLSMLAKRLLSEQIPPVNTGGINTPVKVPLKSIISNTDQVKKLATANIPFSANETKEVKENLVQPKLGAEPKSATEKESVIKRLEFKIKHEKDEKKVADAKELLAKLTKKTKDKSLNEWVENIVEKNYHPFTSKNEIMELIEANLNEQRPQEAPHPAEPDIEVEPGKREAPDVDPDDPFRDPHPGIDPNPKAKKKLSADDAKNKIINLLKKKL
jgi:hypothetical protein